MVTELLTQAAREMPGMTVIDLGSKRADAASQHLQNCGGCDVSIAKVLGADFAITGEVQKVSDMLANMSVYVRATANGRVVASGTTALQGASDDVWRHGVRFLIKSRLGALALPP